MESRWYLAPGQTLENTTISEREHALHVTSTAWTKINSHLDRNRIIAETMAREREYKRAMKEGSESMINEWPDSIERSHHRKVEDRKNRLQLLEQEKLQNYMEMTKEQEDMRQSYIEKVKRTMYYSKAYPKMLNGALMESEAIFEREKQIEFNQKIKEHEMEEERKYAENVKKGAEDEKREEEEKRRAEWKKKQELKDIYIKETIDRKEFIQKQKEERKQKQIADNENANKEMDLQKVIKHEDMLAVKLKKKQELLDYIKKDRAFKAQIQKEEAEVEEVIQIFDEAKQRMACLRKEKDKEIQRQLIERRQAVGKIVMARQVAQEEDYERVLKAAREEAEMKEKEKRLAELEKLKQIRKDRDEDRRQYLERHENEKRHEKELKKWQLLNRQKQESVTKEYNEEKRKQEWEKVLEYRQELLEQMEEKKVKVKEEDGNINGGCDYLMSKTKEEDDKFFGYADSLMDYCKTRGRTTVPIMKVVKEYRRQNLLKNDSDPFSQCRREVLVNTTPGKMCHDRKSDPSYGHCRKCHNEQIYK